MCGLCGLLGEDLHWSDPLGDELPRRRERLRRIAAINQVLAVFRLKVEDFQGASYLLLGATGKQALASGRQVHFIHCARNGQVHAFREFIADQQKQHPQLRSYTCYSEALPGDAGDAEGFLSRELLEQWLPTERNMDAYFLGPKPFMAQVKKLLRDVGVPEAQSRYEFFGPAAALEA